MIGDRKLYDTMKALNISTLEVHRILAEVGINIPQRTLQSQLDNGLSTCSDDRIEGIINKIIINKKELIKSLKESLK